jgi:hypothetical protein
MRKFQVVFKTVSGWKEKNFSTLSGAKKFKDYTHAKQTFVRNLKTKKVYA